MSQINSKPVIILGSGGHAKVVAEALLQSGKEVVGFVTPDSDIASELLDLKLLGNDDVIKQYSHTDIMLANGVGALPHNIARRKLAARMREKGYSFGTIIHPSAVVAKHVILEEGVQVMAGAIIQPGVRVGRDSIVNTGVIVDHDCVIGENCHLAPGVTCSGGVVIGDGVYLGTGTSVIQNISIGNNSLVAAGSVLYRNVADNITFVQRK